MEVGKATGNGVRAVVKTVKRTEDKIGEVKKNIEKSQKEKVEKKKIASQKKEKEKAEKEKAELKERQEIAKRLTPEEKELGEMLGRATYTKDHYYYTSYYGGERKTGKDYENSDMFQEKKENLAIDLAKENIKFGGRYRIYDGSKYVTSVKSYDDLIKIVKVMTNNQIEASTSEILTYAKLQEKGPYPVNVDFKGAMITAGSVNSVVDAVMMKNALDSMLWKQQQKQMLYYNAPKKNGTINVGAGKQPIPDAYNIDLKAAPDLGIHYGDANNLSNIATGSQKRVIINNPYG